MIAMILRIILTLLALGILACLLFSVYSICHYYFSRNQHIKLKKEVCKISLPAEIWERAQASFARVDRGEVKKENLANEANSHDSLEAIAEYADTLNKPTLLKAIKEVKDIDYDG